jgi:hypothetical protein
LKIALCAIASEGPHMKKQQPPSRVGCGQRTVIGLLGLARLAFSGWLICIRLLGTGMRRRRRSPFFCRIRSHERANLNGRDFIGNAVEAR